MARPQLIVALEHAEKAIAHCVSTGNDIHFMSWAETADRVPYTSLYRVVVCEDDRFVRADKDYVPYPQAKRIAQDLNAR